MRKDSEVNLKFLTVDAAKMAQCEEHLTYKCEGLSVGPQDPLSAGCGGAGQIQLK